MLFVRDMDMTEKGKLDRLNSQIMMYRSKGYYVLAKDENTCIAVMEKERHEFISFVIGSSVLFFGYHMSERKRGIYLLGLIYRVVFFVPHMFLSVMADKKQITVYG